MTVRSPEIILVLQGDAVSGVTCPCGLDNFSIRRCRDGSSAGNSIVLADVQLNTGAGGVMPPTENAREMNVRDRVLEPTMIADIRHLRTEIHLDLRGLHHAFAVRRRTIRIDFGGCGSGGANATASQQRIKIAVVHAALEIWGALESVEDKVSGCDFWFRKDIAAGLL
ncbi:hypothetical protein GCM10027027_05290 [Neomicrococcus lactis]